MQLWCTIPSGIFAYRMVRRRALSPAIYSWLGVVVYTFTWISHSVLMLAGDACFGRVARDAFRGPLPIRCAMSVAVFLLLSLFSPVTRRFVPLKLGTAWLGCTITCYLHTLYRDEAGGVTLAADPGRWGFLAIYLTVSLTALGHFAVSTWRSEAAMCSFLRTMARRDE